MQKFVLQIIKFTMIAVVSTAILFFLTNYLVRKNGIFKIDDKIDRIIIGHSHPECAFNDALIADFKNFGSSGESYFYTYFKLTELLKQNKQIKIVFVEFTNNQIRKEMNEWIWGDEYIAYRYSTYAPFMDKEATNLLIQKNFAGLMRSSILSIRNNIYFILNDFEYKKKIGGYLYLDRDKTESLLASNNDYKELDIANYEMPEYSLKYLEKIIAKCKENDVKVYLLRSPMHPKYDGRDNEKIFQSILKSNFSGIEFLDFKDFPLSNSEYGDLEHLNYRGANKFSPFFDRLLKGGLLEKSDKQGFINSEMAKIEIK